MVRVTGPLFSLTARGTYRDSLVFRTRTNGTYVSRMPQISIARSTGQVIIAQKVADLSQEWGLLTQPVRDDWITCGATYSLTGFQLWWREWFLQLSSIGDNPTLPCP